MNENIQRLLDLGRILIEDEDTDMLYLVRCLNELSTLAQHVHMVDRTAKQVSALRAGTPEEEDGLAGLLRRLK